MVNDLLLFISLEDEATLVAGRLIKQCWYTRFLPIGQT